MSDLLLYRMNVITRSTSLPLVRIFEGELGITRRHWHILALLVEHGAMVSSQLATLCWLDRPRVSRALQGLHEKGLVARQLGAGRSRLLVVTATGTQLYSQALKRVVALNAALAQTLSLQERQLLDNMLGRLQVRVATLAYEVAKTAPSVHRNKGRR